jgi:hypothetical protein
MADLDGEAVSAFVAARRAAGHREQSTAKALAPVLGTCEASAWHRNGGAGGSADPGRTAAG